MSKERLKLYKGKRVVVGDKNLVTQHEIHIEDLGGSSSSGSESMIEYLDLRDLDDIGRAGLASFAEMVKGSTYGSKIAGLPLSASNLLLNLVGKDVEYICIDFTKKMVAVMEGNPMEMSLLDAILTTGEYTADQIASLPRITEEQFYNLNN